MNIYNKAIADEAKLYFAKEKNNAYSISRILNKFGSYVKEPEQILCVISTKIDTFVEGKSKKNKSCVFMITNQKILIYFKNLLSKNIIQITKNEIKSASSSGGILSAKVGFKTQNDIYELILLKKQAAIDILASFKELRKPNEEKKYIKITDTGITRVKKAKELFITGVISKKEYNKIKNKYIKK